jgi:hypothetical protein
MSNVVLSFFCPVTKGMIQWDILRDASTLATQWSKTVRLPCPHCKDEHLFSFREAYLEAREAYLEAAITHPSKQ